MPAESRRIARIRSMTAATVTPVLASVPVAPQHSAPRTGGDRLLKWSFVGPTLLFLIALNVFPLLYNVVLSFTNATLLNPSHQFIGGRNYATIFAQPIFAKAIRTTGEFVFFVVAIELVLGFVLALALQKHFRGKT